MAFTADAAYALLERAHAHDRLAHAYLIAGPIGSGKRQLASRLAGLVLGEKGDPLQNPDVHTIEPESKSRRILVEQIRELEHSLQLRSFFGSKKVGIIFDADRLQPQAANAFLKTLEEPPGQAHLLLLTSMPDQILTTIASRCLEVSLRPTVARALNPSQQQLLATLQRLAGQTGSVTAAFRLARDFQQCLAEAKERIQSATSAEFKAEDQHYRQASEARGWLEDREEYFKALAEARYQAERDLLLEALEQWWADVLRQQHGGAALDFPEFAPDTATLAQSLTTAQLLHRTRALEELRENLGRNGVQEQLAIECAFLQAFAS